MKVKYLFRGTQIVNDEGIIPMNDYNYNIGSLSSKDIDIIIGSHLETGSRINATRYPVVSMTSSFLVSKTKYAGKTGQVIVIHKDKLNEQYLRDVTTSHYYNLLIKFTSPNLLVDKIKHSDWYSIKDFEFSYVGSIDNHTSTVLPNYLINLLLHLYSKHKRELEYELKFLCSTIIFNDLIIANPHIREIADKDHFKKEYKKFVQMYKYLLKWYLNSDCVDFEDLLVKNGLTDNKKLTEKELEKLRELVSLCDDSDAIKIRAIIDSIIDEWIKDKENFIEILMKKICVNNTQQTFFRLFYQEGMALEDVVENFCNQDPEILKTNKNYRDAVKLLNHTIICNLETAYKK